MKKSHILPTVVLSCICLVVALLLSLVNSLTAPIIEAAQNNAANDALLEVLPDGKNFKELSLEDFSGNANFPADIVKKVYQADGGYIFQMEVAGYKPGLVIMCGVDADGKIVKVKHLQTQETFGLEGELNAAYEGVSSESLELIIASGATKKSLTSKAYYDAIKAALDAYTIIGGGRTPEQIFQDNCNEALGTTGATFTKWFATAEVQGIDAIYESSDESGMVFVIGETFIGVKADGTIVNAGDADSAVITAAYNAIAGGKLTEITDLPDGMKNSIQKVYVAANGNYVFELSADGYQAMFEYGNGTPISIKLCISADGKIVDVLTVAHKESSGYGDACASEEYYEQYRGQGDENIVISSKYPDHHGTDLIPSTSTDVGIIASATFTTVGYQTAIKDAFAAFKLLTAQGGE